MRTLRGLICLSLQLFVLGLLEERSSIPWITVRVLSSIAWKTKTEDSVLSSIDWATNVLSSIAWKTKKYQLCAFVVSVCWDTKTVRACALVDGLEHEESRRYLGRREDCVLASFG